MLPQWNNLGCGEQENGCPLIKKVMLKWHPQTGLSEAPAGYFCTKCQRDVTTEEFISKAQFTQKQTELKEIQESMGEFSTPQATESEKLPTR